MIFDAPSQQQRRVHVAPTRANFLQRAQGTRVHLDHEGEHLLRRERQWQRLVIQNLRFEKLVHLYRRSTRYLGQRKVQRSVSNNQGLVEEILQGNGDKVIQMSARR